MMTEVMFGFYRFVYFLRVWFGRQFKSIYVRYLKIYIQDTAMEEKVRRHLQASDNISLLNEFAQKTAICTSQLTQPCQYGQPPLRLKVGVGNTGGVYEHMVQLRIANQEFSHSGLLNKNDCKKLVAEQAVRYFEEQRVPFFLARPRNYISLLQSLCQINQKVQSSHKDYAAV